jgi:hypothetical protein
VRWNLFFGFVIGEEGFMVGVGDFFTGHLSLWGGYDGGGKFLWALIESIFSVFFCRPRFSTMALFFLPPTKS